MGEALSFATNEIDEDVKIVRLLRIAFFDQQLAPGHRAFHAEVLGVQVDALVAFVESRSAPIAGECDTGCVHRTACRRVAEALAQRGWSQRRRAHPDHGAAFEWRRLDADTFHQRGGSRVAADLGVDGRGELGREL
jgi:hypothetical protein